jgi:hypothetical protein
MADDTGTLGRVIVTGLIIIMAIPGLIVEPGPLSEVVAVGAIAAVWGFGDVLDGGG